MNYYERHIGDYLKDTSHLSLLEHGVYTRLMDVYYTREAGIPEAEAARLIGARSRDEKAALAAVLGEFFQVREGAHWQDRCDREIERFQEKQSKAKASAEVRWNGESQHTERNANASANAKRTHSEGSATRARPQTPDTKHQKKNTPRSARTVSAEDLVAMGVEPEAAEVWLQIRKAKHAPLSPFALEAVKREALMAGLTLAQAVRISAESGWQGFKAAWVRNSPVATGETPYQRAARERMEQIAPSVAAKAPVQPSTAEVIDVTARRVG